MHIFKPHSPVRISGLKTCIGTKGLTLAHLTSKWFLKRAYLLIGVALVVGMLVFFKLNRASITKELVTLDMIPRPEKLTELYFNSNTHLPSFATHSQAIRFAFVIHNLETIDYHYIYDVSVRINGTRHNVDSGNVLVKDNQYYVKNERLHLINSPGNQNIVVELTNKRQSIDFWTESSV